MPNGTSTGVTAACLQAEAEELQRTVATLQLELDAAWKEAQVFHREADARQRYIVKYDPMVRALYRVDQVARDKTDNRNAQQKIDKIIEIASEAFAAMYRVAREQERTPLERHGEALAGGAP